jgi:hypothetical protein
MKPLTIGEVARQAGVGIETVRFYERKGLLDEPQRRASGYRQYDPEAVAVLKFIRRAKELGFTLKEIKGVLGLRLDASATRAEVREQARAYGYAYPFIELGLGIAYLVRFAPVATNLVTLVVMLVSIVGVTQALLQKRRIQCACLGTVFNLPMTKVTFVEDALMAGMALVMLIGLWA